MPQTVECELELTPASRTGTSPVGSPGVQMNISYVIPDPRTPVFESSRGQLNASLNEYPTRSYRNSLELLSHAGTETKKGLQHSNMENLQVPVHTPESTPPVYGKQCIDVVLVVPEEKTNGVTPGHGTGGLGEDNISKALSVQRGIRNGSSERIGSHCPSIPAAVCQAAGSESAIKKFPGSSETFAVVSTHSDDKCETPQRISSQKKQPKSPVNVCKDNDYFVTNKALIQNENVSLQNMNKEVSIAVPEQTVFSNTPQAPYQTVSLGHINADERASSAIVNLPTQSVRPESSVSTVCLDTYPGTSQPVCSAALTDVKSGYPLPSSQDGISVSNNPPYRPASSGYPLPAGVPQMHNQESSYPGQPYQGINQNPSGQSVQMQNHTGYPGTSCNVDENVTSATQIPGPVEQTCLQQTSGKKKSKKSVSWFLKNPFADFQKNVQGQKQSASGNHVRPNDSEQPSTVRPNDTEQQNIERRNDSEQPSTVRRNDSEQPSTVRRNDSEQPSTVRPSDSEQPAIGRSNGSDQPEKEPTQPQTVPTEETNANNGIIKENGHMGTWQRLCNKPSHGVPPEPAGFQNLISSVQITFTDVFPENRFEPVPEPIRKYQGMCYSFLNTFFYLFAATVLGPLFVLLGGLILALLAFLVSYVTVPLLHVVRVLCKIVRELLVMVLGSTVGVLVELASPLFSKGAASSINSINV